MPAQSSASGDSSPIQRNPSRVLVTFGVLAAIAVVGATIGVVLFVHHDLTKRSEREVGNHTSFIAKTIVADHLRPSDFARVASGTRLTELNSLARRDILIAGAKRVKIYAPDGKVVYSSDPTLLGTETDDVDELRAVLAGHTIRDVSMLNHEGGSGKNIKVLESYAPIYLRSARGSAKQAAGVFEIYSDYSGVTAATRSAITPIALIVSLAMLLLYVLLFPILRRTTRNLKASNDTLSRQARELSAAHEETIFRLSMAAEQRDAETGAHIVRMGEYCTLIARALGMPADRLDLIRLASPLHDVGKIATPDAILRKPGKLTPAERVEMEKHAEVGHRMLSGSDSEVLRLAASIALTHHEKWDGSGYPHGLRGEEIPVEGRIAAIADVFDALTSDRVYRPAMAVDEATAIMREGHGTHFDPELLDLFFAKLDAVLAIRLSRRDRPNASAADSRIEPLPAAAGF